MRISDWSSDVCSSDLCGVGVSPMGSRPARVSVVTPVYNGGAFLGEAIESVLRQTLPDWNYVILDNCSTDETPEIAAAYAAKDSRIRVLRNDRLVPIIANRNRSEEHTSELQSLMRISYVFFCLTKTTILYATS